MDAEMLTAEVGGKVTKDIIQLGLGRPRARGPSGIHPEESARSKQFQWISSPGDRCVSVEIGDQSAGTGVQATGTKVVANKWWSPGPECKEGDRDVLRRESGVFIPEPLLRNDACQELPDFPLLCLTPQT